MLYIFEDYTLDTRRYELRRAVDLVPLDCQVFEVLAYLLAHPDQVVTRQELFTHLWPERCVSDAALERCITVARRALGDNGREQRCIKTVHGRGYRFVAAVATRPDAEPRPLALASPLAPSPLHMPSAAQPSTRTVASEGVWEHKPVAVLAIELTWPNSTEPEALGDAPWQVTAAWQHTFVEQLQEYGGVVLQRSPSLLLVAFGTPQTLEQLPQRAVQAALALRQRAVAAPDSGPCPEVRLVGHWGPLLVDVQAPDPATQHQALGETLAWPVRLLGQAVPGEILVSLELGALVEGWYELEAREVSLAGQPPRPARVYAVVCPKPQGARLELHRQRPLSQFVGRDQELATLQSLMAMAAAGRGQVVGLMGEPGIGKSRLCYEGITRHLSPSWACLETRAVAYGQAIPYLPIIDLLKAYFRLDDRDRAPTIRDKVATTLLALDAALQPTLPAFLMLLDVPVEDLHWQALAPPQRRQRLLDAVKRLVLRASQAQPLLLIVENLHWLDTETQVCLDSLVESLPTAHLLLLVTYRPEYQHGWGHKTYYTQLRLDPLPREPIQALLDALLGDEGSLAPLKQRVLMRTQGNPFFVEESVQSLIETGGVVGEPGAYRLGMPSQTLQVPATVQAVLAARLDRLPAEAKHVLQTAAVIGTEVPLPLLQAVAELDEEWLHRGLVQLQAAEFLYETWRVPEPAYTFKHALTQEVAYGSLVQGRRRALHAHIVEALEVLAGDRRDDQVERLAQHALRGEVWQKALTYGRQAGDKAQARSAYREAVVCYEQALAVLAHLPDSQPTTEQAIDLRLGLRAALAALGEAPQLMLDHLHRAEPLAQALGDHLRLGRVYAEMAATFWVAGDGDRAIAYGQRALALATALGHDGLQAWARLSLGQVYYDMGDYPRAVESLQQNVATHQGEMRYERFGAIGSVSATSRAWLSYCHAECGAFMEGLAIAEEGLRIAETVHDPFSQIEACYGVSVVYRRQGDMSRAIPMLERAIGLCQDWHIPLFLPRYTAALGLTYALEGRVAAGLALVEHGMEQTVARGRPRGLALVVIWLSEAYLLAGRLEEAHQRAAQAVDLARQHHQSGTQAWALWLLGESMARQASPEVDSATGHYRQALTLAAELGMRPLQAHCHVGLGTLYVKVGQREQARTALSTAIALYRTMEMTFWLPRVEVELAKVA
jgi:DNA-binding winged helix-turn-helix (wHTH) protein/tetratricopeptide (TPR) repeat protein